MPRKGWNALSANYRARLQKAGITQADYEAGQSIQKARGHLHTPERPILANPNKHQSYVAERKRLTDRLVQHKQDFFGTSPKWNPTRAVRPFQSAPPPMRLMRKWVTYSKQDWLDAIREEPEYIRFLGYS